MKYFNFHRFLNVARWDLTINSKFYIRAALLMVAIICSPVLLKYLYLMASGKLLEGYMMYDDAEMIAYTICGIGCAITIISSGYMFHNLLTKQGRINELTLPATNLEKFVWHFVVIVVGVWLVWLVGLVFADLLHALFRLPIPNAEIKTLIIPAFDGYAKWGTWDKYVLGGIFFAQICTCFARSFALFNAWKYRYNIPWMLLFYFILWNVLGVLAIFICFNCFDSPRTIENIWNWLNDGGHVYIVLVCLNVLASLLYIGIWLLTYRLYKRAQLTTKRNP